MLLQGLEGTPNESPEEAWTGVVYGTERWAARLCRAAIARTGVPLSQHLFLLSCRAGHSESMVGVARLSRFCKSVAKLRFAPFPWYKPFAVSPEAGARTERF